MRDNMNPLSLPKLNRSYLNSAASIPAHPALNVESVLQELANWRKNKKSRFDPIPDNIKLQIFQLISGEGHKISDIGRKLCISVRQLKAIKALLSGNKT